MMLLSFAALGAVCSFVYSAVTFLEKLISLRIVSFVLDVIMMLSFAVEFFCFVIGFGENGFRLYHFFIAALGFFAYQMTVRRLFRNLENKIANKLSIKRKYFTKRLKKF